MKGEAALAGPAEEAGWAAVSCLRAHEEKPLTWVVCRLKEVLGRLERKEREREKVFSFFFFLNSFQIRFSNFQTSIKQKSMHSNHDAQTLIISRLF
jgi:hypothetical protein